MASNLMTFLRHAHSPRMDVFIGSVDGNSWQYVLPATHFSSHMAVAIPWVHADSIPQPTIDVLTRRMGHAMIYV